MKVEELIENLDHPFYQRYSFLICLRSGDYTSALALNKEWTEWVLQNQHPLSIPVSKDDDIPFFSPYFELKFADVWRKVKNKHKIFNRVLEPQLGYTFHKQGVATYPNFFISLPKLWRTVVVTKSQGKVWSSVELNPREKRELMGLLPKLYLIGIQTAKGVEFYQYLTAKEFHNKECMDKASDRLILTRNLLETLGTFKVASGIIAKEGDLMKEIS